MPEEKLPTTTHITLNQSDTKPDAHYLKLEILQLAVEIESASAQAVGSTPKVNDILVTADKLADFVLSVEPSK